MKDALTNVYTSKEAAEIWGLSYQTVTQWYNRGKFDENEAKKSGGTILVTHQGMERLAGVTNEEIRMKNVLYRETQNIFKKIGNIFKEVDEITVQYDFNYIFMKYNSLKLSSREGFSKLTLEESQKINNDTIELLKTLENERYKRGL